VTAVCRGTELSATNEDIMHVKRCCQKPGWARDFVHVELDLEAGSFRVTADHTMVACWVGKPWSLMPARDLRVGMLLLGRAGRHKIAGVALERGVTEPVFWFQLEEREGEVLLDAGNTVISILASFFAFSVPGATSYLPTGS